MDLYNEEDEQQRLAELQRYEILDTPAEATFDRIVTILLAVFDVDFALVTFVDQDRCWYKAELGLGVSEMPRSDNMCDVVIRQNGVFTIPDTHEASAEIAEPLLRMGFRFYAGAPIQTSGGIKVGTVCAVGRDPHVLSDAERTVLSSLADIVAQELDLRLAARKLEETDAELRTVNRQLEAASQNKSAFLASMSHELRTPLNGILGASELLLQGLFGDLEERQREYVQDIRESGEHLLSLISDVVDLSRVEAGQLGLQAEPLDVALFMEGCAAVVRGFATARKLTFDVEPPSEPVTITADERRLRQVACNLLSNAVKFSREGGAVSFSSWRDDNRVVFAIQDDGPGIAPSDHERIFEQFHRLSSDHEGTGLGLTLARQLVELHGGQIWLESEEGKGSRFYFSVPCPESGAGA